MSKAHGVVELTLGIAARDDDIATIARRQIRRQLETRVVGVIKHQKPGVRDVGQPLFDAVDILLDLEKACELCERLLNALICTGVNPKDAPVSERSTVLAIMYELGPYHFRTSPVDLARI